MVFHLGNTDSDSNMASVNHHRHNLLPTYTETSSARYKQPIQSSKSRLTSNTPIILKDEVEILKMGTSMTARNNGIKISERHVFIVRKNSNTYACTRTPDGVFNYLSNDQCHSLWEHKNLEDITYCPTSYYIYRVGELSNSNNRSFAIFNDMMIPTDAELHFETS